MKVHIRENGPFDGFDIFIISDDLQYIYRPLTNQGPIWERREPEDVVQQPSLRLQEDVLRAMLLEAGKVIPATHATERHLLREIELSNWMRERIEELLSE